MSSSSMTCWTESAPTSLACGHLEIRSVDNQTLYSETGYYASHMRQSAARRQRVTVIASALLHLSLLAALELPQYLAAGEPPQAPQKVIHLVVPPRQAPAPEPKTDVPIAPTEVPNTVAETAPASEDPKTDVDPTKVDPTKAALKVEDPRKELPDVLTMYHGHVGFGLPKDEGKYLTRVFNVIDEKETTSHNELVSMDEYFSFKIKGAGYPLVDRLRRKYHLETYVAYGLFSQAFVDELHREMRRRAPANGDIASARVVISAGSAAGFEVTQVQMKGNEH